MTPEVCVGAVAVHRDRLLMIRRGRGVAAGEWSIPGGRVEAGETLAAAVMSRDSISSDRKSVV